MKKPYLPQNVTDVQMAFPASVSSLMPAQSDIPDEFKGSSSPWAKLQSRWFFDGLAGVEFYAKDGIDPKKAFRHLKCIQGSFEPKHEHKQSAVAFLLSQWFDDARLDGKSLVGAS